MSAAKSLECVHQRPTIQCSPSSYGIRKLPQTVVSICIYIYIYGLKLIVIWVIDVKLVDRQFPAGQDQDDRQAGIFGRHLPAAGRQISAAGRQI